MPSKAPEAGPPSTRTWRWLLAALLVLFAAATYGPNVALPFMSDDYVFLDHTLNAPFRSLWSRSHTDFGWYRPWSREFHFWAVTHLAGPSEIAFRCVGIALWASALLLYAGVLEKVAGLGVASLATLATAALAFWGTSLLWVSGSQDLWMLCFSLASMHFFFAKRRTLCAITLAGALLSKETAGVVPLILLGYCLLIEGSN